MPILAAPLRYTFWTALMQLSFVLFSQSWSFRQTLLSSLSHRQDKDVLLQSFTDFRLTPSFFFLFLFALLKWTNATQLKWRWKEITFKEREWVFVQLANHEEIAEHQKGPYHLLQSAVAYIHFHHTHEKLNITSDTFLFKTYAKY